jgi:hypothetical protein
MIVLRKARCLKLKMGERICFEGRNQTVCHDRSCTISMQSLSKRLTEVRNLHNIVLCSVSIPGTRQGIVRKKSKK